MAFVTNHIINHGPYGYIYWGPVEQGFRFIKPFASKLREEAGANQFYYPAYMQRHVKKLAPLGGSASFYTKEQIDLLPRHARRGGEYGHDPVVVQSRDGRRPVMRRDVRAAPEQFLDLDRRNADDRVRRVVQLCKAKGLQLVYEK